MELMNDYPLIHNEANHRFEMHVNGLMPFITYSRVSADLLIIDHTEVPTQLEGKGIGKMMVEKMLNYIEEQGWKIIPLCPFTSSYIKRHPEWERVVHKGNVHI
jgi:predicted GNAT family acetyltransferase